MSDMSSDELEKLQRRLCNGAVQELVEARTRKVPESVILSMYERMTPLTPEACDTQLKEKIMA